MTELMDSILQSVKKLNNVAPTYTGFDVDFIMFINAAFSDLHQLGIGPSAGFSIEDKSDFWDDFMEAGPILDRAKAYVAQHVGLAFDLPSTSYAISAKQDQLQEKAVRLVMAKEDKDAEVSG
jgi:hypothetical protein